MVKWSVRLFFTVAIAVRIPAWTVTFDIAHLYIKSALIRQYRPLAVLGVCVYAYIRVRMV